VDVKSVSWVGVRTDQYEAMAGFFRDVIGLEAILDSPDFTVFRMPDGDQVEIFGPDGPNPAEQFARNDVVAGLLVDNMDAAIAELRQAGVELIGERQTGGDGYSWQHFRAPDGKVFELCYDPKR
jgi:predicted enzyme related to lactoylglutathione lyase